MSSIARINMLKILLPKRFAIAISVAPIFNAETETTTSGSDVVMAIKTVPIKLLPSPVSSASLSPIKGR
jgi:hypothetical protein